MISKNLAQRLAIAAVFIPLILFLVFRGGDLLLHFILILTLIGGMEYQGKGKFSKPNLPAAVGIIASIAAVTLISLGQSLIGGLTLVGGFLVVGLIQALRRDPPERLFPDLSYIVWGMFYIGLLWPFVFLIRGRSAWMEPAAGQWWLFFLLGAIWLGDTAAMFFGSKLGRHKLAPTISPNKTVEGLLGGYLGILLAAVLFKLLWLKEVEFYHFIVLTFLVGTFGQLGDLAESLWKRSIGTKDSSGIIPGHGGVLDRFDSLVFAAPPVWCYLKFILRAPWV